MQQGLTKLFKLDQTFSNLIKLDQIGSKRIYVVQNGSNWFKLDQTFFSYFSMDRPPSDSNSCINWNQYYTECQPLHDNPFSGAISFDNIGLAWVAIFLVRFFSKKKTRILYFFEYIYIFFYIF